ncbi:hypothetical protein [Occultella gossypii]|uniref:Signal peptidase I n=1 Tax=Occultella gossypii TaxID=2800820 RepID=A0ABS7SHY0_9MICO|nr:hypothetical protein [Occultella gossypii]MBZ2199434.1 hypothetical protein [Occultella gossypii]
MTIASTATPDADDELASLVPARSRARAIVITLVVILGLAAVWLVPLALRPTLIDVFSPRGTMSEYVATDEVLTVIDLDPRAWPAATLTAVDDVAGARVVDVWLLPSSTHVILDDEPIDDPVVVLQRLYPDDGVQPGGNLPQSFTSGDSLELAILWEVTDCAALETDEGPVATLRTAMGTLVSDPLQGSAAGPAWPAPGGLTEVCPS